MRDEPRVRVKSSMRFARPGTWWSTPKSSDQVEVTGGKRASRKSASTSETFFGRQAVFWPRPGRGGFHPLRNIRSPLRVGSRENARTGRSHSQRRGLAGIRRETLPRARRSRSSRTTVFRGSTELRSALLVEPPVYGAERLDRLLLNSSRREQRGRLSSFLGVITFPGRAQVSFPFSTTVTLPRARAPRLPRSDGARRRSLRP